jgi:tripartite-type tricarboxylate transporter receptor subunit TctC
MRLPRRQFLRLAAGAAGLPVLSRVARAQAYPTRPITTVVPFPAGGGTDAVARTIANRMRTSLGQTVIIENLVGASGTIGIGRGARAAGDGYTIVAGGWDTFVVSPMARSILCHSICSTISFQSR